MDQEMSTKMNAEELASKRWPEFALGNKREVYAAAIREVAQPISEELEEVKRERDEYRRLLVRMLPILERAESDPAYWVPITHGSGVATLNYYRELLAQYAKP